MTKNTNIGLWVFGYGSLIWRPAMAYSASHLASVHGWARRFWQGSHDHRGTVDFPGRVLTLVQIPGEKCIGRVFGIEHSEVEQTLLDLDYREKNGYKRQRLTVHTEELGLLESLTYIAPRNNEAWLGNATDEAIANQIRQSHGPSGSNRDYVLSLDFALRDKGIQDDHIRAIAMLLK